MVKFERFQLSNGLKVIFHKDPTTPMAVVNVLYDIGARDESEEKTGFAHLFEHLMFGGSINIPDFDTELQKAGGENNAFTSNDFTSKQSGYCIVVRERSYVIARFHGKKFRSSTKRSN
jgi:zinc protease